MNRKYFPLGYGWCIYVIALKIRFMNEDIRVYIYITVIKSSLHGSKILRISLSTNTKKIKQKSKHNLNNTIPCSFTFLTISRRISPTCSLVDYHAL